MTTKKPSTRNIISGASADDLCASMINDFPINIALGRDPEDTAELFPITPMLVAPKTEGRNEWTFKAVHIDPEHGPIIVEGILENSPPYCGKVTIFSP